MAGDNCTFLSLEVPFCDYLEDLVTIPSGNGPNIVATRDIHLNSIQKEEMLTSWVVLAIFPVLRLKGTEVVLDKSSQPPMEKLKTRYQTILM